MRRRSGRDGGRGRRAETSYTEPGTVASRPVSTSTLRAESSRGPPPDVACRRPRAGRRRARWPTPRRCAAGAPPAGRRARLAGRGQGVGAVALDVDAQQRHPGRRVRLGGEDHAVLVDDVDPGAARATGTAATATRSVTTTSRVRGQRRSTATSSTSGMAATWSCDRADVDRGQRACPRAACGGDGLDLRRVDPRRCRVTTTRAGVQVAGVPGPPAARRRPARARRAARPCRPAGPAATSARTPATVSRRAR